MQPSLRTFPLDGDLISTFEKDPTCDPTEFKTVGQNHRKYDVLFPELLQVPLRRNPIPSESRPAPANAIRGFLIRWFEPKLPWLPYLPAVVTYHYPIFQNMNRSPDITVVEGGFVIDLDVVKHWSNVESVMRSTIERLLPDALVTQHRFRLTPSSCGYRQTFPKRSAAKKVVNPSLMAFQHMLAYCSYVIASTPALHFFRNDHKSLYEKPATIAAIFEKTVSNDNSSHILHKLLWSTLGEIHQTRNLSGAGITYAQPYDCQSVEDMHHYGVPLFVCWSDRYCFHNFLQSEKLMPWRPPASSFPVSEQSNLPNSHPNSHPNASSAQQPPLSLSPVPALNKNADRYPWEYVESRKAQISSELDKPQRWLDRENAARSFKKPGKHGALIYQFNTIGEVEKGTGEETRRWKRTLLTRAQARDLWNDVDPRNLWYDCELNQWNHCYEFDLKEDIGAHDRRSNSNEDEDDEDEHVWGSLPSQSRQSDPGSLHTDPCTPQHNEDVEMAHDSIQGQSDPGSLHADPRTPQHNEDVEMAHDSIQGQSDIDHGSVPSPEPDIGLAHNSLPEDENAADSSVEFDTDAHLGQLLIAQYDTLPELVTLWNDVGDFFYQRYGLIYMSTERDNRSEVWYRRLGAAHSSSSLSLVELHKHVVDGAWPPGICDLSPDLTHDHLPLAPSPHAALRVSTVSNREGYLVTVESKRDVDWKLLIRDPLTLLQIERLQLDCDPHTLIISLVKKGIPFQILNPQKLEKAAQFYDHPGPVVHPIGKEPQPVDYLSYRQELGAFFAHYPHAYAAALSAGGILWRIAMDVLPLLDESDITRQFHPNGCISMTIEGEKYWTPQLTQLEEDVVVGVYRWPASSKDGPREDCWWPKHQAWDESGLDFGAWAPLDEWWYAERSSGLQTGKVGCVRAKVWKDRIKYGGKDTTRFLTRARALTREFVREYRL